MIDLRTVAQRIDAEGYRLAREAAGYDRPSERAAGFIEAADFVRDMTINDAKPAPIPMRLPCPDCGELHIDEGEFATRRHATHACQHCGAVWRPAVVDTVGVRFLPGFKNAEAKGGDHV